MIGDVLASMTDNRQNRVSLLILSFVYDKKKKGRLFDLIHLL